MAEPIECLTRAAVKWRNRIEERISADGMAVVSLRVRIELGHIRRISSLIEEDEPIDLPPSRRIGPPRNAAFQLSRVEEKAAKYLERLGEALSSRDVATHILRAKVEDGSVYRVNMQRDEDEPIDP